MNDNPAEPVIGLARIGRASQRLNTEMAALRVQTAMIPRQLLS